MYCLTLPKLKMFRYLKFNLPLTYPWVLRTLIPPTAKTILDVGCGDGYVMFWINHNRNYRITGVDISKKNLEKAKELGIYNKLYRRNLLKENLSKEKFDVVFCSQVIEHLKKGDALKLLSNMEKIAEKRIIVATTNGFFEYDHSSVAGKYDKHESGWRSQEFQRLGFRVRVHGLKLAYEPNGIKVLIPQIFQPFLFLLSYVATPLVVKFPRLALFLIAYKDITED